MLLLLLFAALAGIVTVLSPCILPVLPVLLASSIGAGAYRSFGIITGLILSFSFFTLSLTALVKATGVSPDILRYAAIFIIIFFGLTLVFEQLGQWIAKATAGITQLGTCIQMRSETVGTGFLSGFILGIALGLIWTPCAGPILAAITALVATSAINFHAIVLTFAYAIGAAIPMFFIMYGSSKIIASTQIISHYSELIRKFFGILMILGATALAFHADIYFQQLAIRYFPSVTIDDNPSVRKELATLSPQSNPAFSFEAGYEPKAPEIVGIQEWINSNPLTIKELVGKVILIDFWTYSCINCVRTLPYIKEWYATYKDRGLVIIGVHTPEFEFEKNLSNVKQAVERFGILYPVALDNEYQTWRAYNNRYWPAHYLIDQQGFVKKYHFGEGGYKEMENAIRSLLNLAPMAAAPEQKEIVIQTPEIYLGYSRARNYQSTMAIQKNQNASYDYQSPLSDDQVGLKGIWTVGPESIQSQEDGAILELNFIANRVYLVMESPEEQLVELMLDGKPIAPNNRTKDMNEQGQIRLHEARMYDLLDLKGQNGRDLLSLTFKKGAALYAFTFGSSEK